MTDTLKIDEMILKGLVEAPDFSSRALPHIKPEYFETGGAKHIITTVKNYEAKYGKTPTWDAIIIDGNNEPGNLKENGIKAFNDLATKIKKTPVPVIDSDWLYTEAEKYCKDQALYNSIASAAQIYKGEDKKYDKGAIPSIVQDALSVTFDTSVGHDYTDDAAGRWDNLHNKKAKIPFDLDTLNKITGGGAEYQTLNMILAGTHVGKSLMLCHLAGAYMSAGHDVVYVTLEMAQEKIAARIDCNLLDVPITQIDSVNKNAFISKVQAIKNKTTGRLIIKEFPTTGCTVDHLKALLNEIKQKKGYKPRILILDYINLMASNRLKSTENSYQYIKSVSEELRGLAVKENLCIWSATQTNRQGASATDFDMTATSESFGLPMTVDFMIGAIRTEELDKQNQVLIKQLKSRYGDTTTLSKFNLGMDRAKFRLYETESTKKAQVPSDEQDKPVMDNTGFGQEMGMRERRSPFLGQRKRIEMKGLKT